MLHLLELLDSEYFIDNDVLYIKINNQVYRYTIVKCKNLNIINKAYVYKFRDEYTEDYLAFPTEELKKLFSILISINSVGFKTAKIILELFSYQEIMKMVENLDYDLLTKIKGFGIITAKNIIESLQKSLFNISFTPRETKIIQTVTRLGYSRGNVLKVIKNIDKKLKDEDFIKQLLSELGKKEHNYV